MNITLLEYLRQDHGVSISGLDPLPEDEHGIDIPLVFNTIRQAIMGKSRWNIEEMAFVGLFSFGQFVMWNDIRNRSKELEENKVVASLIKGAMSWEDESEDITADSLDSGLSLKDMAIPVSADSSQMVAILKAARGQSFVLHGPPGTGKSQTITNMIANALYQGKSVLFVAEKMAALNVVQKRLADIGLNPFCLELHSNKTNKTSVLSELDKTLEVGRIKSPEEYEETAEMVHQLRSKLNHIIEALHCRRAYGISLYEAIELFERNQDQRGCIAFSRETIAKADKETVSKWNELITQYGAAIAELGAYASYPLLGYEGTEYSIELRENLKSGLESLISKYDEAAAHLEAMFRWARLSGNRNKKMVEALLGTADGALMQGTVLTKLISSPGFAAITERLKKLSETGTQYNQIYDEISGQFEASVFDYQAENARLRWKQAENSWFLPKLLEQSKLVKELRLYARVPGSVTKQNITSIYDRLSLLASKKREIVETPAQLTEQMEGLFMGTATDWEAVNAALVKSETIHNSCSSIPQEDIPSVLAAVKDTGNDTALAIHRDAVRKYIDELGALRSSHPIDMHQQEESTDWFGNAKQLLETYRDNIGELRNKVTFNQKDKELRLSGLEAVSTAYKEGRINSDNLMAAYTCNLYYELVLDTIAKDERLADFHGKQYNLIIDRYREAIEKYQQLTIQEMVARLSSKIPSSGTASAASSEMGILKKAIKNNGRMMSLRRLFDQIPTLLRKLCPCMLMSPISVAQYIDPSFPKFDLVIFDEASQIPTSEAVGAIARGENVVIVGDPKQLPPTNFFSSTHIDEENCEKEDLESLLDDCLAISMPQEYLKWHYRSRHESLIAYSNMKYYDNKLYTFPSPRDLVSEVRMVHLEGFYDKGKTKQNKAEAKAIVNEIIRRLRDENLRNDSIGVVTFSSVQQNLIDDMLYEEFRKHPELEEIDSSSREPIFIKNLENVQGDERDVILFSVGYGPDADGNVSMNFGPLNRDGGWRRLNVAISRARKAMIVYSVLRPEQINLARTRSEGVAGLKGFLEFAELGRNMLAQRAGSSTKREDYMLKEIARAVEEMGYQAKCNIGCSEFKMDIGIINPNDTDTYLLGIMLDGQNCRDASTARDRFVLQPGVLKGLGWNIIRIWTLDWLDDPERVKKEIKEAIEEAQTENKTVIPDSKPRYAKLEFEKVENTASSDTVEEPYVSVQVPIQGTSEEFYLPQTLDKIRTIISAIIEKEAPVSRNLLMHKVLNAWGISRGGSRVEGIFSSAVATVDKNITGDEDRAFFWRKDQVPEDYGVYRVEDAEGNRRSMDDVPSQEILNAVIEVLKEQVSLSEADLIRETAKKFGFTRLGNLIESSIKYAINAGLRKEAVIRLDNGNIARKE